MQERRNIETPDRAELMSRRGEFGGINLVTRTGDKDNGDENVPLISQSIEVELSVKKAFEHLTKTKIGSRKTLSSNTKQDLQFKILIVNSRNVTKFQIRFA